MVLIYCVPFQCLWTEEKETDDLEVRSIFLCVYFIQNYCIIYLFCHVVQIVVLIFLLSNNITVLIIRFKIWLSVSSCHCLVCQISRIKKASFFFIVFIQLSTFCSSIIFSHYCKLKTNKKYFVKTPMVIYLFYQM